MRFTVFAQSLTSRLATILSAWVWILLIAVPAQATLFRDGLSVSEYEGATEAVVRADAAVPTVPTVSDVRGPDLGGVVGGLVASLRYTGAGQAPLVRYNLSNGREHLGWLAESCGPLQDRGCSSCLGSTNWIANST